MPTPDSTTPPGDDQKPPDPCSIWICYPGNRALPLPDSGWKDRIHPDDMETVLSGWRRSADTSWSHRHRIRGDDGEYRTVASHGIPVRDARGRVVLWVGVTGVGESCGEGRELATLTAIARVIEEGDADPEEVVRRAVRLIPGGFRHPEEVSVRVVPGPIAPGPGRIVAGRIVVEYRKLPEEREDPYLPQERGLVRAVTAMLEAAATPVHGEAGASNIMDRRQAEEALGEQQIALDSRVRELATLYAMNDIVERPGITIDEILTEIVAILPAGWLHPEDAAARITLDGREYRSPGFVETCWRQESPIVVCGRIAGKVEICYLHEEPAKDEGPFLLEERSLIDAVAARLGRIIERVRADEGLRRSEEKYRLLFEQMLESYTLYEVILDDAGDPIDYRLAELNEKATAVFGCSRDELIGRRLFDIFPAIREGALAIYGEVAETGIPTRRRLQEPKSGRWYDLHIYRPEIGRLVVTGQEITGQKKAELALQKSEERFRGIFEQAGTGIALIDPEGRIMEANPAFVRMFGYDEDELHAMLFLDLIYPPDRETARTLLQKTASGESARREKRYVTKDGRILRGRLTTSLLCDPEEEGLVIGMVEDVTDRREMQNALRESEERFREIAQRSFDMIYTCYNDRGITYISPAVTRILGYTPEEMIGVHCGEYILETSRQEWLEAESRIARGEPVAGLVVGFRRKNGTAAAVEMNESPIMEGGRVIGVQVVGRDISDRKRYEDMRLQAFSQIEQNIEQFAVLADHIRLPLQVILGTADLTDDTNAAEKIRRQVERINRIVKQLDEGWVESREIREFLRRNELV
ncbi:PAS fold protein [anaerobic digester metagenome]